EELVGVGVVAVDQHAEDVHEGPQELARDDPDVAAEALGHLVDELLDELARAAPLRLLRRELRVDRPELQRHLQEALAVEGLELELRLPEARHAVELLVLDSRVERLDALHALAVVEEGRRPGEDPEELGVAARE